MKKIISIVIIIVIVIVIAFVVYRVFFNDKTAGYELVEVARGSLAEEVLETGWVQRGDRVNLNFKNAGRIEDIYVRVGDRVEAGQKLAKLDTADIDIQFQEARISLELAQLNLNKLLAGASPEEVEIAETQTEIARTLLSVAEENLKNSYEQALPVLNSVHPQIYNTFNFLKDFVEKYVIVYDAEGRKIVAARDEAEEAEEDIRECLKELKTDAGAEKIEAALLMMRSHLKNTFDNLENVRHVIDDDKIDFYQDNVLSADKAYIDTFKINVNTALANVISSWQMISSMKLNFQTAKKNLKEAENRLSLAKAQARQVDIDLYQAQIRQAENKVRFYENQIQESNLASPVSGKIIEIKKKKGELAQPTSQDAVMVIMPLVPFEIKADIYEGDVVKLSVGNPVEITLVALPREKFEGKITFISPAEKIIDGVVYYEITVGLEEVPENIKPTMTADIVIQADLKQDVLVVHRNAVQRRNGKTIVEVFKDGAIEEREIEIGMRGADDMTEVIFGLEEGEKIVIWK